MFRFFLRVLLDILKASSLVLFEGAVMSIIKEHGGDIGLQKVFSTFGGLIFGPVAGILIDVFDGGSINRLEGYKLVQPKFFWNFRLKLNGEVWAKSCLDTNFQPIWKSFYHVTEAPKVPR